MNLLDYPIIEQARAKFIEQATDFQLIGVVSLIVATIFASLSFVSSLWLLAPLSFIPTIMGIEIIRIGSNAKELVNQSFNQDMNQEEFISVITDKTVLMGCFLNCSPKIVEDLYKGYYEVAQL